MFKDKQEFITQLRERAYSALGKDFDDCSAKDRYYVLANLLASKGRKIGKACSKRVVEENKKKVYYFSP